MFVCGSRSEQVQSLGKILRVSRQARIVTKCRRTRVEPLCLKDVNSLSYQDAGKFASKVRLLGQTSRAGELKRWLARNRAELSESEIPGLSSHWRAIVR
jgi:hypothetical protein